MCPCNRMGCCNVSHLCKYSSREYSITWLTNRMVSFIKSFLTGETCDLCTVSTGPHSLDSGLWSSTWGYFPCTPTWKEERKTDTLVTALFLSQSIGWCAQCQLLLFTSPYLLVILDSQANISEGLFFLLVNYNISLRVQAENKQAVKLGNLRRV